MTRQQPSTYAAAAMGADWLDDLFIGTARDVHGAVAGRVFGMTDKISGGCGLSHRLHDGISKAVYCSLSGSLRVASRGLRAVDDIGVGEEFESTSRGRFVTAAVNGLIGDRLREEGSPFWFDLGVRVDGRDVVLDREGVAGAFPGATEKIAVFVHGLSENEAYWHRPRRPLGEERRTDGYGELLAQDGWTPVYIRVNTGLPLSENGVALAAALDRLVESWPCGVRRIALVGHSMGGLIARAACAVSTPDVVPEDDVADSEAPQTGSEASRREVAQSGAQSGAQSDDESADRSGSVGGWTDLVTDVVLLGTPNLGAPLERAVNRGVRLLDVLPEAAPFGRILEYRSVGILDLRHGLPEDVQNLPHARYRLVAATLTRSARSVTSSTVGDYLVPYRSALGRDRHGREMFPGADTLHVPRADHFDLLNHDAVADAIRMWLADEDDAPTYQDAMADAAAPSA